MSAREATSTRLADEGVFIFRLGYVVDIQHLHCPLFFRCKKAAEIPNGGTCQKLSATILKDNENEIDFIHCVHGKLKGKYK
jgi:hypothetical protein